MDGIRRYTHTSVSETEDLVASLEASARLLGFLRNDAREFDTQDLACLWRERVVALALQQVHAIEAKGFDLHNSVVGFGGLGHGHLGDKQSVGIAGAVFDVCGEQQSAIWTYGECEYWRSGSDWYRLLALFRPLWDWSGNN